MRLDAWMAHATEILRGAGIDHAQRDSLLLAAHVTGLDKAHLLAHPEMHLPDRQRLRLARVLDRRAGREPIQYILGVQEFWGLPVRVGPGCLIPRPETEHLVEAALEALAGIEHPAVAEIGAGSGCVLMALAKERPDACLTGVEMDPAAARWAGLNVSVFQGVRLVAGDVRSLAPMAGLDAVVSNPPYITDSEWEALEPEVRVFEPSGALRCGDDPLGPYRAVSEWSFASLRAGGFLACELGVAQARRAAALRGLHRGLKWEKGVRDLAGRLRVGVWRRD